MLEGLDQMNEPSVPNSALYLLYQGYWKKKIVPISFTFIYQYHSILW
jgi:hypothetical protein